MKKKHGRGSKHGPLGKSKSASKAGRATKDKRRPAAKVRRVKKSVKRAKRSIGQAAARVVKSGARLVGHAGQRVIAEAVSAAKAKVHSALESAAEATLPDTESKS